MPARRGRQSRRAWRRSIPSRPAPAGSLARVRGHRAFIPAVVAAVFAMAGCGGSDHSQHAQAHGLPGLLGGTAPQDTSAGTVAPYHPTGKIVVDLGFRRVPDGFGFENDGNDQDPQNLTPARVADLFGP